MNNKQEFTRLRRIFGFEKDKDYLAWVKSLFPGWDVHHLLGSTTGKKFTDYLVFPLPHEEHLNQAEKYKADYCLRYFNSSVTLLLRYVKEKLGINYGTIPIEADTGLYDPYKVNELIQMIQNVKKRN